ncbi:MAG TPA: ATPase, T2SS/T4P/T4SS family [Gammaproteobacteria bacterium]
MSEPHGVGATVTGDEIALPQPPMCAQRPENAVRVGERVVVIRPDGDKLLGELQAYDPEGGTLQLRAEASGELLLVDLASVKMVNLPELRLWLRASLPQGDRQEALLLAETKQQFRISFVDGDVLEGETWGSRPVRQGLFLFPAQSATHFTCTFIPNEAIAEQQIGERIGRLLVDQQLLSEEQLDQALQGQQAEQCRPLGDYLRTKAVVTVMELERALQRQQSAPNFKLGEILVGEHMITEQQLHTALKEQRKQRKLPLGEMLVKMGVLSKADIQRSLVRKMGIPFVDLHRFDIDMEAVRLVPEQLARRYNLLPLYMFESKLVVALDNPMDWDALDALRFHTNLYIEPVMAPEEEIREMIPVVYGRRNIDSAALEDYAATAFAEESIGEDVTAADNLIVKLINKVIVDAFHQGASDVHIEPSGRKQKTMIRIRRDGVMLPYYEVPARLRNAIVARIKVMAGLDVSEHRRPQDGKIEFERFGSLDVELRVATLPTVGGQEDVVIRLLGGGEPMSLNRLGMTAANLAALQRLVAKPYGMLLVAGPTGSGKTTTLHSLLKELNTEDRKIWTAEDPVEITQIGLRQVQVNPKIGLTFASALRAFLRADPDVIMVGEMRDHETVQIALEASLTGHLVLSTLHTNNAPESVTRLLEMGVAPYIFADAMLGVVAQRLARLLCPACRRLEPATPAELEALADEYNAELLAARVSRKGAARLRDEQLEAWTRGHARRGRELLLGHATGCAECGNTGYRGRIGIHEVLEISPALHQQIVAREPAARMLATALKEGMRTLKQDGIDKVLQGLTDIQQVRKVCLR